MEFSIGERLFATLSPVLSEVEGVTSMSLDYGVLEEKILKKKRLEESREGGLLGGAHHFNAAKDLEVPHCFEGRKVGVFHRDVLGVRVQVGEFRVQMRKHF